MKKYIHIVLAVFIAIGLTGCYSSSTNSGAVGVKRKQFMMLSSKQINQGAKLAYTKVLSGAQQKHALNKDRYTVNRLNRIMRRLVPQTTVFRPDAINWKWEVNLIQSDQLNAWCMPGGKIAFYSGIIKRLKLNDAQIAAIMGHEMSHALREHSRERASRNYATQMTINIGAQLLGLKGGVTSIANQVANVTLTLPNSREAEREADRIGIELAARAGYDPREAIKVWEKMAKLSKNSPPEILSTHPIHSHRIADLKRYSQVVWPLYLNAKNKRL
jgi:predicted Zn-dependent protease